MEREMDIYSGERNKQFMELEVTNIAPDGLGYGDGGISKEANTDVTSEVMSNIEEAISSPDILVPVATDKDGNMLDDDGCGDGRGVKRIFMGTVEKFKSLNRSKVFGGGVMMSTATRIGLGKAHGKSLRQTVSDGISSLRDKQIGFGAHTDTHAHGANCGCGAIDKAPEILANSVKFKDEIRGSISALGIDTSGLEQVVDNFEKFATSDLGEYEGSSVASEVADNGKIIKELDDDHKEVVVLLNLVEGFTVDQELIREVSGGKAQGFAVDVWRVKQIADRLYAGEPEEVRHQAFLSELVYTLATAATLTKGDLPVFAISKQPELVSA